VVAFLRVLAFADSLPGHHALHGRYVLPVVVGVYSVGAFFSLASPLELVLFISLESVSNRVRFFFFSFFFSSSLFHAAEITSSSSVFTPPRFSPSRTGSTVWLSPAHGDDPSCYLGFVVYMSVDGTILPTSQTYLQRIQEILIPYGARPHWYVLCAGLTHVPMR
jgi:hypothetical protein